MIVKAIGKYLANMYTYQSKWQILRKFAMGKYLVNFMHIKAIGKYSPIKVIGKYLANLHAYQSH